MISFSHPTHRIGGQNGGESNDKFPLSIFGRRLIAAANVRMCRVIEEADDGAGECIIDWVDDIYDEWIGIAFRC